MVIGSKPIAARLMQSGTDIFGVANLAKPIIFRSVGKGWPILMLGPVCLRNPAGGAHDVRPTISSMAEAEAFAEAAQRAHKVLPVHLKVDTGMGRLGVPVSAA